MSELDVADVPARLVTVTSTRVPTLPAGAVAVMEVEEWMVTEVAGMPPKLTPVDGDVLVKLDPVMVTTVPPAGAPALGEIVVTLGADT